MGFVECDYWRIAIYIHKISSGAALLVFGRSIAELLSYAAKLFPGEMRWKLDHVLCDGENSVILDARIKAHEWLV